MDCNIIWLHFCLFFIHSYVCISIRFFHNWTSWSESFVYALEMARMYRICEWMSGWKKKIIFIFFLYVEVKRELLVSFLHLQCEHLRAFSCDSVRNVLLVFFFFSFFNFFLFTPEPYSISLSVFRFTFQKSHKNAVFCFSFSVSHVCLIVKKLDFIYVSINDHQYVCLSSICRRNGDC